VLKRATWIRVICAVATATLLTIGATAGATIIGGGRPGLGGDDFASTFVPNLNPIQLRHIVLAKETFDPVGTAFPHEWGFYFTSDPSTRYPIFTTSDQAPPEQQAVIDFDNGKVVDLDASALEASFGPSLGEFGFYLSINFPAGPLLTFSDPALNSGTDTFASFPFLANPLFRQVAFEVNGQIFSLEVIDGALPVPEPMTAALVAGGIALLATRRRA
jgi:hypothetical protein